MKMTNELMVVETKVRKNIMVEVEQVENEYPDYDYRICDECNSKMYDGFVVEDTFYYCKKECLHANHTPEEYEEMYEEDSAYWTEGFSGWSPNVER